jgi:hypothetical protein
MAKRKFTVPRRQYCDCDACRAGVGDDPDALAEYMRAQGFTRKPVLSGRIVDHAERFGGDLGSSLVHAYGNGRVLEIHIHPPTRERPFYWLLTAGLSDVPMNPPAEAGPECRLAELSMALPPDWRFHGKALERERFLWPVKLLIEMASVAAVRGDWIWYHHAWMVHGSLAPNVPFTGALLHPSVRLPEESWKLTVEPGIDVWFLSVYPLHPGEVELWKREGAHALIDRLTEAGVTDLVDLARPPVA